MSNYSVSTSESGSFASNAALYTAPSRHRPSARDDSTPKKAAQSTKSTAAMSAAQESPSMTIRRVPADYSERLEDQKARSSALERYKMLVKANRLVPSDGEASPLSVSKRKKDKGEIQNEEDEKEDMSTTWRLSDQLPSYVNREQSAASQTVLSDVSDDAGGDGHNDGEEAGGGAAGGDGGFSEGRPSAEPRPPHSLSRGHGHSPQHGQWNYGRHSAGDGHRDDSSTATSVSVSVSVERPAYPRSATTQQQRTVEAKPSTAAAAAAVVPQLNLSTTPERPVQPVTEAASASKKPHKAAAAALDEMPVDYVAPELTQPYVPSSLKPRSSLRPGYEPVMEHRSGAFTRTSSISTEGLQHGGAGAGPATPRRKSTAKAGLNGPAKPAGAAAAAATTTAPAAAHVDVVTAPAMEEREEDAEQQQQQDSVANSGQPEQSEDGVVPLPGSKTAFWLRPSSATYDMTASIAAKRKDHVEGEGSVTRTRTSSRRNNSHAHGATATTTSRTGSPCGTPRGRASEQKPRFSTHMSAADRRQYEENASAAAAVPSTASSTYDTIFSTRQSTVQRGSTRRSVQAAAAAPAAAAVGGASTYAASSSALSSRGTPRGNSQRRAGPPTELVRTPSSLSRHSSHTAQSVATESAKVVSRQQEAQARHCARVAAGEAARAEAEAALALRPVAPPAADSKAKRLKKKDAAAEVAPPPPQQRSTPPPPAQAVSKKLSYEAIECDDEEGAGPVPHTVVPQSSKRHAAAAAAAAAAEFHTPVRSARSNDEGAGDGSPQTTIHGRRGGDDGATPSKSRRREHDTTASPPRDDSAAVEASFAAREAEMAREKEAVKARQAREALESCRQARLARAEAARTSHSAAATASTNEIVAAMLQGVVQQTRQVLPCYLCAELQSTSGYRVHISACRPAAEATLRDYYTNVAGLADTPAEIVEHVERVAALEVPLSTSDMSVREAYTKECYRCVKSMLVPCRKCHTQLRVQDLKEHEMLCGRAYYQNSRAAERVRSTVDRVERGAEGQ